MYVPFPRLNHPTYRLVAGPPVLTPAPTTNTPHLHTQLYDAHGDIQLRIITFRSMVVKRGGPFDDGPYKVLVAARLEKAPESR